MIDFGANTRSSLKRRPLLIKSQSAESLNSESFTSSQITNSTPQLGTMERMAMLKLKNSTNRMSHVELAKRRNTDKHQFIKSVKTLAKRKKKDKTFGLTSE